MFALVGIRCVHGQAPGAFFNGRLWRASMPREPYDLLGMGFDHGKGLAQYR